VLPWPPESLKAGPIHIRSPEPSQRIFPLDWTLCARISGTYSSYGRSRGNTWVYTVRVCGANHGLRMLHLRDGYTVLAAENLAKQLHHLIVNESIIDEKIGPAKLVRLAVHAGIAATRFRHQQ
jgi:hypothetical protein